MGQELIVCLLEIDKNVNPNWKVADIYLKNIPANKCQDVIIEYFGCDDYYDTLEEYKTRLENALLSVKNGWSNLNRNMTVIEGHKSNMLIAAGESWGDSISEIEDLELFITSGMSEAAGFWS